MIPGAQCALCSQGFVVVYTQGKKSTQASAKVTSCPFTAGSLRFEPVSLLLLEILQKCCFAQICKLQPATLCHKRSVEICYVTGVIFFFLTPLHKSQKSSAARTKAGDSQRNVVQARKINLLAPKCSSRLLPKYK